MFNGSDGLRLTKLEQIPGKLAIYEELIKNAEPLFDLEGAVLEHAIKSHVANMAVYDMMLNECKTIEAYLETKKEELEAQKYKHFLEHSQRALGARDLTMYIRGDSQVTEVIQIILEVNHVRRQLEAIVETFKTMGWSLSNIVKLRVAQLDHTTI